MRWDGLKVEEEASRQLPGYREPATVRTFDAPEAMDIRFYEVRAKSALNRVPAASRMPFRWTVNPYRGCTHACTYCIDGDTPILLANGRTKPMREIEVGDRVYGTECRSSYRHYAPTEVLAHWKTSKPAYRVVLEDGRELVASGDHRFLTRRGWKYVTGTGQGSARRPHLTVNSKLMGTGAFVAPPPHSVDYQRGYLCGMIRGDGHLGSYSYQRPGRTINDHHRFRLALADLEALWRTRDFLAAIDVPTKEFAFHAATASRRAITAIRTSARDKVEAIRAATVWPTSPTDEWRKGFLAGIFDAEGSHGQCVRIANSDPEIIGWTVSCLQRFGFTTVVERPESTRVMNVRLRGGLPQVLRFFHTVDPAITRKRVIDGIAIKTNAPLGVAAIEPLGPAAMPLYDMTTGTGDFIANGVVSHNCFARPTHKYLDLSPGRDFEREIIVKVNAPEALRAQLSRPSWKREHVALGTNTDPYQWVEGRYKLMPGIWEALRDTDTPCSVLTKSPLLLRDLPLLKELADRVGFTASLSVPTLDEKAWRATEPHTPHPRARLEAVAELNRAGVPTGILIAPLMPGINDSPAQVEEILRLAGEAGATSAGGLCLHLRGEVRGIFFDWLRTHRPDLVPRYEQLYARGAYAPREERDRISRLLRHKDWPPRQRWSDSLRRGGPMPDSGSEARADRGPDQPTLF